ncbi:hypothetical protein KP509_15G044000 [Ceratopteris richardii]|nr:hypothetical protein KP509_15G044000 [Ceratopteris richardii]
MALILYLMRKRMSAKAVYIIDYSCAKPPDETKTGLEAMFFFLKNMGTVCDRDILFQSKVFLKSGIGEEAHVPRPNLTKGRDLLSMADSYSQAQVLVVGAVDTVLKKTGVRPHEVDILVVNCGLFNPTPSLTALLVNHFKMREDVKTFHLAGMGCSAGLISLGLAADLLRAGRRRKARYALVASAEVIQSLYDGKERPMMVTNCLFRSAGNAVLLSGRKEDRERAKMEVAHVVRATSAQRDEAYHVVELREDDEGIVGASLSPQIVQVAGDTLSMNVRSLAPKVLPWTELCKVGWAMLRAALMRRRKSSSPPPPYVPNFKRAFEHFCVHPGGRAVIEGIGKGLRLSEEDLEPSVMALHRFGNTSCSGVFYILAYMEAKGRLRRGDRVWQIGLGSGFKCVTAVLHVLRDLDCRPDNPWYDCVHRYPVKEELSKQAHIVPLIKSVSQLMGVPNFKV